MDRDDAIASKTTIDDALYATDDGTDTGNYVGYVTNSLTTSEGVYEIDSETGEITFTPNNDFSKTGDPDTKKAAPIRVIMSNLTTNTDEGPNRVMSYGYTRPAHTINANNASYSEVNTLYTPTVTKPSVTLTDVAGHDQAGRAVTLRPDYAQENGAPAITKSTVELIGADGTNAGKTLTVADEGTWKVNNDGSGHVHPERRLHRQPDAGAIHRQKTKSVSRRTRRTSP